MAKHQNYSLVELVDCILGVNARNGKFDHLTLSEYAWKYFLHQTWSNQVRSLEVSFIFGSKTFFFDGRIQCYATLIYWSVNMDCDVQLNWIAKNWSGWSQKKCWGQNGILLLCIMPLHNFLSFVAHKQAIYSNVCIQKNNL